MKKFSFCFLLALLLIGCEKEDETSIQLPNDESLQLRSSKDKITICHKLGNGSFKAMEIPGAALSGHLRHGDILADADRDGYTFIGACMGSADDCDDTNPNINPGAGEECGNDLDDNCNGEVDEGCCTTKDLLQATLPDGTILYVYPEDNSSSVPWGNYNVDIPEINNYDGLDLQTDFNGAFYTQAIVNKFGPGHYAAKICSDLVAYGCDDWYLPAIGELIFIQRQLGTYRTGTGDIPAGVYWSSSEGIWSWIGWSTTTIRGFQLLGISKENEYRCRCVRR